VCFNIFTTETAKGCFSTEKMNTCVGKAVSSRHRDNPSFSKVSNITKALIHQAITGQSPFILDLMPRRRVTPHVLRHTFAVAAVQKGISTASLQRLLGHDHLATNEIYLNLSPEDVVREFREKW
jgi:integrase